MSSWLGQYDLDVFDRLLGTQLSVANGSVHGFVWRDCPQPRRLPVSQAANTTVIAMTTPITSDVSGGRDRDGQGNQASSGGYGVGVARSMKLA